MAIKGKKKSQSRGSQGARRPAQAPRPPAYSRRGPTPFYNTRDGRLILGLFAVVAIGVAIWAIGSARHNANEVKLQAQALDHYTNEVRGVVQSLIVPAGEMGGIPTTATPDVTKKLKDSAERWKTSLTTGQSTLAQINPDPDVQKLHELFGQALSGYIAAANTYEFVPLAPGPLQDKLLAQAAAEKDQAGGVVDAAIGILDQMRGDLDLGASGLRSPLSQPTTQPSALPTSLPTSIPTSNPDKGSSTGGKKAGGKKSGGQKGSGGNGGG
jgi:hypothetical protein